MSIESMSADRLRCRSTERRTLATSVAAHALLFVLVARVHAPLPPDDVITEVSLLEPAGPEAAPAAPAAAPAAPASRTVTGALRVHDSEVHFRRSDTGTHAPDPQSQAAFQDRLNARLATLQRDDASMLAGLSTVVPPAPQLASPAGLPSTLGSDGGLALRRAATGTGGGSSPLSLTRGPAAGGGTDLELAALPAARAAHPGAAPSAAIPKRFLAGMSLAGPISDRPVLSIQRPDYPEWAKREGVEGRVTLYFVVLPDGTVKDDVMVQKTAGFSDFDDNAVAALRAWRFAPLAAGRTGDQWGTVSFQYRLAEAQ